MKRSYFNSNPKPKKKRQVSKTTTYKNGTAWRVFSLYTRTRDCVRTTGLVDYGKCISCGKPVPRKLGQAGHFLPGRHNANLFYERGCHFQCYGCNFMLLGNTMPYMDAIIKLYGPGIVEELRENDRKYHKFILEDLKEKVKIWRAKIKEWEEGPQIPR